MTRRSKTTLKFVLVCIYALFVGIIAFPKSVSFIPPIYEPLNQLQINLGLDLQGGLHVEYKMDLSTIEEDQRENAKNATQAVIERRVNAFGVGESLVQVADRGDETYLIIELPGVGNIEEAKAMLQETPYLEFREQRPQEEIDAFMIPLNEQFKGQAEEILVRVKNGEDFNELAKELSQDPGSKENGGDLDFAKKGTFVPEFDTALFEGDLVDGQVYDQLVESDFGYHIIRKIEERGEGDDREVRAQHILIAKLSSQNLPIEEQYTKTELTGAHLKSASMDFSGGQQGGGVSEPVVILQFNKEGAEIFAAVSERNVGKQVATFVDGELVSAPIIQEAITGGTAQVTGNFSIEEAKDLSSRLNEGALPVPIELASQQSIEASLGQRSLEMGLKAGLFGLLLTIIYMIVYYRFLGVIAAFALAIYGATIITMFKLSMFLPEIMHITLSLAGIAGLILSIGMAVDANILIFERLREELRHGRNLRASINEGYHRAWPAIRDGNLSTILTSVILIGIGTGFVKGFALILVLGVLVSMFTAIVIVRIIMDFVMGDWIEKRPYLLIGSKKKK